MGKLNLSYEDAFTHKFCAGVLGAPLAPCPAAAGCSETRPPNGMNAPSDSNGWPGPVPSPTGSYGPGPPGARGPGPLRSACAPLRMADSDRETRTLLPTRTRTRTPRTAAPPQLDAARRTVPRRRFRVACNGA